MKSVVHVKRIHREGAAEAAYGRQMLANIFLWLLVEAWLNWFDM